MEHSYSVSLSLGTLNLTSTDLLNRTRARLICLNVFIPSFCSLHWNGEEMPFSSDAWCMISLHYELGVGERLKVSAAGPDSCETEGSWERLQSPSIWGHIDLRKSVAQGFLSFWFTLDDAFAKNDALKRGVDFEIHLLILWVKTCSWSLPERDSAVDWACLLY